MATDGPNGENDYQARQAVSDKVYVDSYKAWVASLSDEELREIAQLDLEEPECGYETFAPDYSDLLERTPAAELEAEPAIAISDATERLGLVLLHLADSENIRLELYALLFVFGFTCMMGLTETEIAAKFGIARATFSKRCIKLKQRFNIPPSRSMRPASNCETYRLTNGRLRER